NFLEEDAPDATTLLKFRRLLEQHGLNKLFFDAINRVMVETGHMLKGGTVVDATIINAPPSTKNAEKKRDPEMHQTKKGNEWRFGMKCHVGVDAFSGLVHTIEVTSANVHDICATSKLIREDDEVVYGDSGYLGIEKREEIVSDAHLSSIDYRINRRPSSLQKVSGNSVDWDRIVGKLNQILVGYFHYYGITDNMESLENFCYVVRKSLFFWLNRRSERRSYDWDSFNAVLRKYPMTRPKIYVSIYG
ncbi:MAG: IS5 family transposase, partial [Synergistaceae bacterium]|nr:IS5 family transposase [Synergistaceae bacterium]